MGFTEIDIEKQPIVTETSITLTPTSSKPSKPTSSKDALAIYQTLVGDITAKPGPDNECLYQDVQARSRQAFVDYVLTATAFAFCVLSQIILCLGIAAGAQMGLHPNAITVLASVNTAVAAITGILKGLGLPEKKAMERHKLQKIAEKIRFTTRKLKAGLAVDAAKEAEDTLKMEEECEDEAQVLQNIGDAAAAVPVQKGALG